MKKRVIASLLSVCMLFSLLPMAAFAEEEQTGTQAPVVSVEPTAAPSEEPTQEVEATPTEDPSAEPTPTPEVTETPEPTTVPTVEPTTAPSEEPVQAPVKKAARAAAPAAQASISGEMAGYQLRNMAVDGVITLDGNVTLTSKMSIDRDIVLDLNGHTVTATGNSYFNTIEVNSGKTLTIQDSVGGGKITDSGLTGDAWSAEGLILTKGTLKLEGGTIESAKTNCVRVGANSTGGMAILDGAELVCTASMKSGIEIYQNAKTEATAEIKSGTIESVQYGLNVGKNHNATVTGGTITVTGSQAHGVQIGGNCDVSLKGCTIKATGSQSVGVYAGSKKVTLENVVVESKANAIYLNSECEVTISGDDTCLTGTRVIVLSNGWSDSEGSSLTITGGTVRSEKCNPLKTIDLQGTKKVSKPEISGGTFNTDVTAYVAEGMAQDVNGQVLPTEEVTVPMGSVAEVDGKGYTTLTAAFAAVAAAADKTITLLADVDFTKECTEAVAVDVSGVTIDLNGKTVTTGYTNSKPLLTLLGDFTLKNGNVKANGSYGIFTGNVAGAVDSSKVAKIVNVEVLGGGINAGSKVELTNVTATGNTYYAVWADNGGHVTIKNGNYSSGGYAVLGIVKPYVWPDGTFTSPNGSITVEDGTFTATGTAPMVLGGEYDKPLIKGGTFNKDMTKENATLDEGLQWKEENGKWTVEKKPEPVARDDSGTTYTTLQEAVNAVNMYDNLTLLKDVTEDITVENGKGPAIALDGHMLHTAATVKSGGYLRLENYNFTTKGTDTATWVTNNGDQPVVTVEAGGEFELSQGGMKGTGSMIQNSGGRVTLGTDSWLDGTVTGGVASIYSSAKLSETAKNSIGEVSGKEWLTTIAPEGMEGNWYICSTAAVQVGEKKYGSNDLQLAINQAGEGETVKLLNNVTASVTVGANKKITLDLNGKRLEGAKPSVENQEPTLKNLGELTITGNGTIRANSNNRFDGDTVVNNGILTIESGNFQTKSGHVSLKNNVDKANVIVKGGKFAENISAIAVPGEGLQFTADGKGVEEKLDETNAAAKIVSGETTTYYKTLQAAIDAATEDDIVTLVAETVTESVTIAAGKNITLDLNGKKLEGSTTDTITNNGTLTIKDSAFASAGDDESKMGKIVGMNVSSGSTTSSKIAVVNNAGGICTIESGMITRAPYLTGDVQDNTSTNSNYTISNKGEMTIAGGLIVNNSSKSSMVANVTRQSGNVFNGTNNGQPVTMNITGGTLKTETYTALKNDPGAVMNISNGDIINNTSYVTQFYGTVNVSGGNFTGGDLWVCSHADNTGDYPTTVNVTAGTLKVKKVRVIYAYTNTEPVNPPKAELSISGTVDVTCEAFAEEYYDRTDKVVKEYEQEENVNSDILISGGTFHAPVEFKYCAENFLPVANEGGTYGVVEGTLAISASSSSLSGGGTVTLTVAPAGLTADVAVTCDNGITVTRNENGTYVASLPNTTATYTFTATVGDKTATCEVRVTRYTSGGGGSTGGGTTTRPTQPEENIDEPDVPLAQPLPFTDVAENDWFYDAVRFVYDRDMMKGADDGTVFQPAMTTTRGMIVTILHRLEGEPEAASTFNDVAAGAWYTDAVNWAAANGIVKGFEDGSFRPEATITRQEMAAILSRYASFKGYDKSAAGDMSLYNDKTLIGDWALEDMTWAVGVKVLSGKGNNLLDPVGTTSRAEAAQMLKNFCEAFAASDEK